MLKQAIRGVGAVTAGLAASIYSATLANAEVVGQPKPYELNLQPTVTPVGKQMAEFHDLLLVIITAISVFVLALLVYVIFRYNSKRNPTPSKFSHNTLLEFAWTLTPIFILVIISVQSFKLLFVQYDYPKPDLVIKAIGNQWYWDYEYPDQDLSFSANIVTDRMILERALGEDAVEKKYAGLEGRALGKALYKDAAQYWAKFKLPRLLATTQEVVVPVNKNVHVLVTAADVLHNWTVPAFGSKVDAVPGRLTSTWFRADRKGVYYGQCSELCGKDHAFMPISVRVVEQDVYDKWLAAMKEDDTEKAAKIIQASIKQAGANKVASVTAKSVAPMRAEAK